MEGSRKVGEHRHRKLAEAARALNAGHPTGRASGGRLPALFLFTDENRTPDPLPVIADLPEGCGVVFRHYGAPRREAMAHEVARACRDQGRLCLVGADAGLARAAGAGGVHLPEAMLRRLTDLPQAEIVTAAAHGAEALARAEALGVDAVFLSPVFATASHPDARPLGVEGFTHLVSTSTLPVYALGGITDDTAGALSRSGAAGLAAIGGLL